MRFIPIQSVQEGTLLKKSVYSNTGQILLREGTVLKNNYITALRDMGINGLYIDDDISKDIEVISTISERLKNDAVQKMKATFSFANKKSVSTSEMLSASKDVQVLVENVIDEILSNKNFMINMIDLKVFDDYTFHHSVNVTTLSIVVGINMGLTKSELTELGLSAILHDIGKVFTPKEVLNKNGKLESDEWEIMKNHAEEGYRYLKDKFNVPSKTYLAVLQHHEKWDGTGYPLKLAGEKISLYARIISVADVYDALTSDRPYRKGLLPSEAMEYIMGGGGSLFDPKIVQVFYHSTAPYPNGTIVKLSNGFVGIVVENVKGRGIRPILRILKENNKDVTPYIFDLGDLNTKSITIVEISEM